MRWVESERCGEDLGLDLGDVVVDPVDHRLVVVDDLVDDRPHGRRRARLEQLRVRLEPLAHAGELARGAVAHGDHVRRRDEQHDLAELDLLLVVVVARGAQDDEVGVVVVLELRPLVGAVGVLERELVQVEALADVVRAPPRSARRGRARRSRRRRRRSSRATSSGSLPSCWRTPSR